MTSWDHPYLIRSKDTPYNRVTITKYEDQVSVFEDGALSYETESIAAEEYVQLSTLNAPSLDNVLVLGNGFSGVITELLKLPVKKIDYVEINKDLIETLEKHLPEAQSSSLKNEKVKIIYQDPRQYLNEMYLGETHSKELRSKELQTKDVNMYDAIIAGMPEPASAQSNRFYTIEFFRQCASHMNEGAVLAFKISSAENLWTPQLQIRNKSIYNALSSVFKNVVVLPGTANIFIASKSELLIDPAALTARFNERKPITKLVTPEYINYIYTNDRFAGVERMLSNNNSIYTTGINSDLKPACYRYTLSIWLSKFFTGLSRPDEYLRRMNNTINPFIFYPALIIVLVIIIFSKRLAPLRRFILVVLAGFIGMILETILILNYQSKSGILYRDIGILLMAFMAGLTLGSYLVNKLLTGTEFHIKKYLLFGITLLLGFAALNIIVFYLIKLDLTGGLVLTSLSLIADGIFVAAIFAFASLSRTGQTQAAMIPLYSADLIGGCMGSVAASLILIPVYGLLNTSLFMASAALCTLVFIW